MLTYSVMYDVENITIVRKFHFIQIQISSAIPFQSPIRLSIPYSSSKSKVREHIRITFKDSLGATPVTHSQSDGGLIQRTMSKSAPLWEARHRTYLKGHMHSPPDQATGHSCYQHKWAQTTKHGQTRLSNGNRHGMRKLKYTWKVKVKVLTVQSSERLPEALSISWEEH
jgi:hypothetical protein